MIEFLFANVEISRIELVACCVAMFSGWFCFFKDCIDNLNK